MMLAWFFPGQGSQSVGMGRDLLAASPAAKAIFDRVDDVLGERLSQLILEGPEADLMLTANAQPAIVTVSIAVLAAIRERYPDLGAPRFAAGHSLGEYSALVAAGALSLEDAVRVVRERGRAMQEAVPPGEGAMAAVMNFAPERLEEICRAVESSADESGAPYGVVSCANFNAPGQIVIAGTSGAVTRVCTLVGAENGKTVRLKVSAPFHCSLMAPAAKVVAEQLANVTIRPLAFPVVANVDARPNTDPGRVVDLLVRQVDGAVRWEQTIRMIHAEGVSRALEIGPGKVLAGLAKRTTKPKELSVLSVGDVASLESLESFLNVGGAEGAG
jgi:[acyl-carrier-protein] S-malonyltransferase